MRSGCEGLRRGGLRSDPQQLRLAPLRGDRAEVRLPEALGGVRLQLEPEARGVGLGTRLVDEVVKFARGTGYRRLTLWTNDNLTAARRVYEKAGFKLVSEERHKSFGHELTGQYWELLL